MNNSVEKALIASLDQFGASKKTNSIAIEQRLVEVFGKDLNFLEKVAEFDEVFDEQPQFEELREVFFDLLMINFFTSDVNKLEEDYLETKEWESIEEETIDRGTELLNLLLYINECHDEEIKPSLEDFLKEFLLVEEDEFQDEFHIYEDLITNQQLAESSIEDICNQANLLELSEEMEELFVPFMAFFLEPNPALKGLTTQQELIKFSNNKDFDVAVYTLITNFNLNR